MSGRRCPQPQASSMAGERAAEAEAIDSDGTEHSSATSRRFADEPRDDHLLYHRNHHDLGVDVGDYLSGEDDDVDSMLSPSHGYTWDSYPYGDELHDAYNGELSYDYHYVAARFDLTPDLDRVVLITQQRRPNERHLEPAEAVMQLLEGRLDELESALQRLAELVAYGSDGFGAVPASAASVAALEKHRYEGAGGAVESAGCVICIQDYEVGDDLSVMPCSYRHRFHEKCLAEWLARSRLCPLCRHALPTDE